MSEREVRALRRRVLLTGNLLNTAGGALVAVYFLLILPEFDAELLTVPTALGFAASYSLAASLSAHRTGTRYARPVWEWLPSEEAPTDVERRRALRLPARLARITLARWLIAAVVFGLLALLETPALAAELATTLVLAALTISAAQFLVAERVLRPVTARALHAQAPPPGSLDVGSRLLLAWLLCSAIPMLMLALIPVGRDFDNPDDLVLPTAFVAACALSAGFFATKLATGRVATPLGALRDAVDAVAAGDLSARVTVDDASEVGRLQAGFNEMVAGLEEREKLRDLIDRSVGRDVAAEALERGAALGGQVRNVSALFADVVGSTAIAARERPEAVVELLNRFFATVVAAVERHGGFVNKFEGDGALCLFGAPAEQPDHAARCLAAARELAAALEAQKGVPLVAIGVSCGDAVAGWVGAESRFEYTVIGDPVNEAARLTELAKSEPSGLLASAATVEAAGPAEAVWWELGEEVVLRGRDRPTRLATARPGAAAGTPAAAHPASGSR